MQGQSSRRKAQQFRYEIRRRQVEKYRNKIRAQFQSPLLQEPPQIQLSYQQADVLTLSNPNIPISQQTLFQLEKYSLMPNQQLWGNRNILNQIFSILGAYMLEYKTQDTDYYQQKLNVIAKIQSIFRKMLKDEIEWVNEDIQYLILGSSVCLPVLLTVIQQLSATMIPLYKRLIQSSLCKSFKIIETQVVSERQLDSSGYLTSYKQTLHNLYLTIPKIKLEKSHIMLKIFELLAEYTNIIETLTPFQYKSFTFFSQTLLQLLEANIRQIVFNEQQNLNFLVKVFYSYSTNAIIENKLCFFKLLGRLYELSQFQNVTGFLRCQQSQLLQIFMSEFRYSKDLQQSKNIIEIEDENKSKKLIRMILDAFNSMLLSQVDDNIISYNTLSENQQQQFIEIAKLCQQIKRNMYPGKSSIKQLGYFYYSIIQILPIQQINAFMPLEQINQLIYDSLTGTSYISQLIVWLKVLESLLCKIRQNQLSIESVINPKIIELVEEIFNNHQHQKVVKSAEIILQIISEVKE